MSDGPRLRGDRLAIAGVGITVVALAATLEPIALPPLVPIFLLALGIGLVLFAALGTLRDFVLRRAGPAHDAPRQRQLIVTECRRVESAVVALLAEHDRAAPRARAFPGRSRTAIATVDHDWIAAARYGAELRDFALRVYDAAVSTGAASPAARTLVEGRTIAQIRMLPELFATAADAVQRLNNAQS